MAVLRATLVARVAEEERLSIALLAKRLGVSKTRAQQLLDIGKRLSRGVPPEPSPGEPRAAGATPPDEH